MTSWAYDFLRPLPYGTQLSYKDLSTVITIPADSHRGRAAILRAGRQLLQDERKLLVNVRSTGYQIAQPNEHVAQAKRYRAGARRRLRRAWAAVVYLETEGLTPKELTDALAEQVRAGLTLAMEKQLSRTKQLPAPKETALPSGQKLLSLITKAKPSGKAG